MSLLIRGIGTAIPDQIVPQSDAARLARNFVFNGGKKEHVLAKLFEKTCVHQRYSVVVEQANGQGPSSSFYPPAGSGDDRGPATELRMQRFEAEATPLAVGASGEALTLSEIPAGEITHLITVTCTGFYAPGFDIALIKQLGLRPDVQRVQVGFMGCHGALNGLRAAKAFVDADPRARVLMCCVELCTLHFYYGWDRGKVIANALFSDGAAALVAGPADQPNSGRWDVAATGSYLIPDAEDDMTWRIGNHGFEMTLSSRVPELISVHLKPWLESWLANYDLTLEQIGCWAIHPGGPRIVHSVGEALDLPAGAIDTSLDILADYGNMSSPTILFVIQRLQRAAAPLPCVALGFGPGLMAEAALFV